MDDLQTPENLLREPSGHDIHCQRCQSSYHVQAALFPQFCAFCGSSLSVEASKNESQNSTVIRGRYDVIHEIGKGGMGEVLLVYDRTCERKIALKKVRSDLVDHPQIIKRFLKEAHITCQLNHPGIIPIYTISHDATFSYYTMPFVEGQTLKQLVREIKLSEKRHQKNSSFGSISSLTRIFLTICQTVAYAHSKGIIHRDLKLENIIVGKYGEVLLLDWGLAKKIDEEEVLELGGENERPRNNITLKGKIVGTINYMAPERLWGKPANQKTDIYSLGVILYYLLTLVAPFKRGKTLREFRKVFLKEKLIDPIVVAPYRDIPKLLSRIVKKCLDVNVSERYQTVTDLIRDIECYLEGRSEWFEAGQLDINKKKDWQFQENIWMADHIAITRDLDEAEWVNMMVSRESFIGNVKIETELTLGENAKGVGFLLGVPEPDERAYLHEGYCLWLGSDVNPTTRLLKSNLEVFDANDIFLKRNRTYRVRIEHVDQTIHLYLDDILQFSYIAHVPLSGTHIGILARDADFKLMPLKVFIGSLNITVNCLAVPDAFLAHQDYQKAISEYRRIAYSFPDRPEGREAIFRAGLAFIEQAKKSEKKQKETFLNLALEEFEKLHQTAGAPLEYLGKTLVYQILGEWEEEIKCFELAYRRYSKHPLLIQLQEQLIARMHELSRINRPATYYFALLALKYFAKITVDKHTRRLFSNLRKHWEPLYFIQRLSSESNQKLPKEQDVQKELEAHEFEIELAFWLARPYLIEEALDHIVGISPLNAIAIGNGLFALLELNAIEQLREKIEQLKQRLPDEILHQVHALFPFELVENETDLKGKFELLFSEKYFQDLHSKLWRFLIYFYDRALDLELMELVIQYSQKVDSDRLTDEQRLNQDGKCIWALLLQHNWEESGKILHRYPVDFLTKDNSPLHFLYGCWLRVVESRSLARIHFRGTLIAPYPRSWMLASHYILGRFPAQSNWFKNSFLYERIELYRHLVLYYTCTENHMRKEKFYGLLQSAVYHSK